MLKTKAERQALATHILNDMRLEGLEPDALGKSLMERLIKGEITTAEAIALLDEHYKGQPSDMARPLSLA